MLIREVEPTAPSSVLVVVTLSAAILLPVFGRALTYGLRMSQEEQVRQTVTMLGDEWIPRWQHLHPGRVCPTIQELIPEIDDRFDVWGNSFVIQCHAPRVYIRSFGVDGEFGTADDVIR